MRTPRVIPHRPYLSRPLPLSLPLTLPAPPRAPVPLVANGSRASPHAPSARPVVHAPPSLPPPASGRACGTRSGRRLPRGERDGGGAGSGPRRGRGRGRR